MWLFEDWYFACSLLSPAFFWPRSLGNKNPVVFFCVNSWDGVVFLLLSNLQVPPVLLTFRNMSPSNSFRFFVTRSQPNCLHPATQPYYLAKRRGGGRAREGERTGWSSQRQGSTINRRRCGLRKCLALCRAASITWRSSKSSSAGRLLADGFPSESA